MDYNSLVSYTHIDIVIAVTGKIDQYKICVAIGRDFHPLSDIHVIRLAICDLRMYQVYCVIYTSDYQRDSVYVN